MVNKMNNSLPQAQDVEFLIDAERYKKISSFSEQLDACPDGMQRERIAVGLLINLQAELKEFERRFDNAITTPQLYSVQQFFSHLVLTNLSKIEDAFASLPDGYKAKISHKLFRRTCKSFLLTVKKLVDRGFKLAKEKQDPLSLRKFHLDNLIKLLEIATSKTGSLLQQFRRIVPKPNVRTSPESSNLINSFVYFALTRIPTAKPNSPAL